MKPQRVLGKLNVEIKIEDILDVRGELVDFVGEE